MNYDDYEHKKSKKKKHNTKEIILVGLSVFFLGLAFVLIAIYFFQSTKKEVPKERPKPQKVVEPEKPKLKILDEDSNERPLAVMIDNNINTERHAGLQESFVNYEIIVEGGLTRIMAIFKDRNVGLIGPVRSSRHYFLDYALEYDSVYAHFGWSPYAETDIRALNVNNINGMIDNEPFYRDRAIAAPHNVFTSTDKLRSYFKTKSYSETTDSWKVLNYSVEAVNLNNGSEANTNNPELIQANQVSMSYSPQQNRSYTYDSVNEYYLRFMNGVEHIDKTTAKQLSYKNIIIMKVNNKTIDREGRQDLDTVGMGDGFYITNGYALPIKWSKPSRSEKTQYTYNDGTEVTVNDGNTFIQIVPLTSEIIIN